ncbi:hypothetical protein X797_011616 [Metarhizium robertsii]|uniref:Uncharacterized protein n=1 Tax=Metarhizium robertsii TaxID=568076 RepID=A0A014PI68_9HYPO|nr:hypothetical protein X797_011616 [Metarhizium robertsii]
MAYPLTTSKASNCSAKQFAITRNFSPDYSIVCRDGEQFHAILGLHREEGHTNPCLSHHQGLYKTAPVSAMMPCDARTVHIGVAEPQSRSVTWNDMDSVSGSKWMMTISTRDKYTSKNLTWKHTRSSVENDMKVSPISRRNVSLQDLRKDYKPLAVYTSNGGPKTSGTLQMNENHGEEFDIMVLMTCLAISEAKRGRLYCMYLRFL